MRIVLVIVLAAPGAASRNGFQTLAPSTAWRTPARTVGKRWHTTAGSIFTRSATDESKLGLALCPTAAPTLGKVAWDYAAQTETALAAALHAAL